MNVFEVRAGGPFEVWVKCSDLPASLQLPTTVELTTGTGTVPGRGTLHLGRKQVRIKFGTLDQPRIDDVVRSRDAARLELVERVAGNRALVTGRIFLGTTGLARSHVNLSEEVVGAMPASARSDPTRWFQREFEIGEDEWAIYVSHGDVKAGGGFDLIGRKKRVTLKALDGGNYTTENLRLQRQPVQGALLLKASLTLGLFHDTETPSAGSVSKVAETAFTRMWRTYNELERKQVETVAADVGTIPYESVSFDPRAEHFRFRTKGAVPPALTNLEVGVSFSARANNDTVRIGDFVRAEPRVIVVKPRNEIDRPQKRGELVVDLLGSKMRLDRRDAALNRVAQHESRLPDLMEITDGRGRTEPRHRRQIARSSRLDAALGERRLTEAQRRAIEVALNTPDIALIWGPPGTGKTTVIRAIAERLDELGEVGNLFTAYQHDALLRMIEDAVVGGVPVPRMGGRSGVEEEDWTDNVESFVLDLHERLRAKSETLPKTVEDEAEEHVVQALLDYRTSGVAIASARRLIRACVAAAPSTTPGGILEPVYEAEDGLTGLADALSTASELAPIVEAQRVDPGTFSDDGALQARRLLLRARRLLTHEEHDLVRLAAEAGPGCAPPDGFAELVADLRNRVQGGTSAANPEDAIAKVERAADGLLTHLSESALTSEAGIRRALQQFRDDVLEDPGATKKSLIRYASTIAATTQQSANARLVGRDTEYRTILVDEAARANPLDLLVAISRGERIILVGDDRQLPHVLETEVVKEIESTADNASSVALARATLQESLFGRLLRQYEKAPPGAIQRVQLLDTQFRSAPVIARFISKEFYGGRLKTPDDLLMPNDVGRYDGDSIAWLDVRGQQETGRYHRRREVDVVGEEIELLLAAGDATIGVITFYREQATALRSEQKNLGWDSTRVRVGTVDAFQGREFDVAILSCVRSNRKGRVGFLALANRICVAMSRARKLLIVAGDPGTTNTVESLENFRELCAKRERVYSR